MMIKGLIVNHTAPERNNRRHANGGKLPGLFHRNVKKPVYFPDLDSTQPLNS